MTFRTATGQPQVVAVGWVGLVCSVPAVVTVACHGLAADLPVGGSFTINLPREELLLDPAWRTGDHLRSLAQFGLTLQVSAVTGGLLISDCPLQIECQRGTFSHRPGQPMLKGEVRLVHHDGVVHGLETPVDCSWLRPFTRPLSPANHSAMAAPPVERASLHRLPAS